MMTTPVTAPIASAKSVMTCRWGSGGVEERRESARRAGGDQCPEYLRCCQGLERAEHQERPADQGEDAERAGRRVAHRRQPPGSVAAHA
jgi:hypothetical protein